VPPDRGRHGVRCEAISNPLVALGQGTLWPMGEINRIIARPAKFSPAELRKMHRRIATEPGPTGNRQAISSYLSLVTGPESLRS
jgi:hypothetical protein